MAGFTDAVELTLLDHFFRGQSFTPPATVYLGYSVSTGTECTDANYVRQAVTLSAASSRATTNSVAVTFPAIAVGHNVVQHAVFSAASGGYQITDWVARTGGTLTLTAGQQNRVPVGDYDASFNASGFTDAYANAVIDYVLRNQALSVPATVYAAYSSSAGTEATDANYVRKAITAAAATSGSIANSAHIDFEAAAAGHNVVEMSVWTAATSGTQMLAWKALTGGTEALAAGQVFRVAEGDWAVTLD
jgi:hypothetical protein